MFQKMRNMTVTQNDITLQFCFCDSVECIDT